MPRHPFQLTPAEASRETRTNVESGLSTAEARRLAERYGPNRLEEAAGRSVGRILWDQLAATLTVVLIVAAVISSALGDYQDALAILAIVILNTALGVTQESKAERAIAALKKLATPLVRVRRDAAIRELASPELVPGDVVLLETGNIIPADLRLLESVNLRLEEAALTGESEPVEKEAGFVAAGDLVLSCVS